ERGRLPGRRHAGLAGPVRAVRDAEGGSGEARESLHRGNACACEPGGLQIGTRSATRTSARWLGRPCSRRPGRRRRFWRSSRKPPSRQCMRLRARRSSDRNEVGYPDVGTLAWQALFAPSGTPKEVLEKLAKASIEAMHAPASQEVF